MKIRSAFCFCLAVFLLFSLSACFTSTTVTPGQPTTAGYAPANSDLTYAPTTINPEATTGGEPELPTIRFNEDYATPLGEIDTEIFGKLSLYYQQDRIVIFDSFGSKLYELYAEGYRPAGAVDVPVEVETEEPSASEEDTTTEEEETTQEPATQPEEDVEFDASLSEISGPDSIVLLTGDDVNFDGYTDFYLLYSHGNLNTYYFFWLWDMNARRFVYYLPLSSIPTPTFDRARLRVVSSDRRDEHTLLTTEYVWSGTDLIPVAHGETTINETETAKNGLEDVDTSYSISGRITPTIQFRLNPNSASKWICRIENAAVLRLVSDTPDVRSLSHRFAFRGMTPGTTTVVFRYAKDWNADFVAERIFNVTVDAYGRVTFRLTE